MNDFSWTKIAIMVIGPLPLSFLVAGPFWRRKAEMLGNLAGSAVIFGTAIVLILKESAESDAFTASCLQAGLSDCFPVINPFTRYAIYAFIGLVEVIALFLVSLRVERRLRDRDFAPEWRRG